MRGGPVFQRPGGRATRTSCRGGESLHPDRELVDAGEGGAGGGEGVEGEVERLPVVAAEEHVADLAAGVALGEQVAQREEVAGALGHLLAVHAQVRAVHPELHERLAGGALGLGDLVLVVREEVVDAAGVDVERLAEVLRAHRGALDVPAGAAGAPRGVPLHVAVVLVPRLPQREVADVVLGVLVVGDADRGAHAGAVEVRELAVVGVLRDGEVDRPVGRLVGVALLEELPDESDHLRDVVRRGRVDRGAFDAERVEVLEERFLVGRRVVAQRDAGLARAADRLVVHVREVHDVRDLEPRVFERAAQQVLEHVGAEVADVGEVVDRGAAGVHPDRAGDERLQRFDAAGERVVELRLHDGAHSSRTGSAGQTDRQNRFDTARPAPYNRRQ